MSHELGLLSCYVLVYSVPRWPTHPSTSSPDSLCHPHTQEHLGISAFKPISMLHDDGERGTALKLAAVTNHVSRRMRILNEGESDATTADV